MEKYSFLGNAKPEEVEYYKNLIDIATWNNTKQVEGMYAVEFFQKSGLGLDVLSQIWEKSWILKNTYLSPPEIIIYCKYIAMYQSNIPLTYENLAMYNSQLPYPKFNFSVHEGMNVGASTADAPGSGGSTPPQVSSPSYSTTPPQSQPQEEDDDFGDFVDSNVEVPQPPPKELTEEEKKKKEEEDRLKRLDLISSAFDDALFEDEKPPEEQKAEVKATTEFQQTANQPMEVDQNHASQEESKVEHQKQEDMGWANFASTEPPQDVSTTSWREDAAPGWGAPTFSEDNKKDEDAKEEDEHDFGDFEDPVQEPPAHEDPKEKPQASPLDDDPFAEIDMEVQKESEQEEGAIPDCEPQLETKKSGGESFPSLFNAASTPRVDNDMDSDIRMSFPSQEMWGNSFSGPNKDNLEKEKSEKEITNTGWASGAFEFKPSEPAKDIIQEDDKEDEGFQDIMDLKDDKKHQEDTGFWNFAKPEPQEKEPVKTSDEKEENNFGSFGQKGAAKNEWGNFAFPEDNNESQTDEKNEDDSGWANFTTPEVQNEENAKKETKNDPFESANDPFQNAFSSEKKDKEESDEGSEFGDFADPVATSEASNSKDTKSYKPSVPFESNVPSDQANIFHIDTTPAKTKEFNEKEMFKGFMKAVNEISKSHPTNEEKHEIENSPAPAAEVPQIEKDESIKKSLMAQVAKAFGDSENIDLEHLAESKGSGVTLQDLQGKLQDKEAMDAIAQKLVKQENYKGAEKIWKHNEIVARVSTLLEEKKAAAANEEFEKAMKIRDEANDLQKKMLTEQQIIDLFEHSDDHQEPTLKFLINQVLYRVDDSTAEYFIPKFLRKMEEIDEKDFSAKVALKKELMMEALVLLKVTKIGIDWYKTNCDEVIPLLTKEIDENHALLTDLCKNPPEIIDALEEEEKFMTFLKGIKALSQILKNFEESTDILDQINNAYTMNIEVFCQEIKEWTQKMKEIEKLLDDNIGISPMLMRAIGMKEKVLATEASVTEGFRAIQRDKYNCVWSLCGIYIVQPDDEKENTELYVPERRIVFNNVKEEQQTYHNYWINLWINRISANPN